MVGLPAGFEVTSVSPPARLVEARQVSLSDRLVGPLTYLGNNRTADLLEEASRPHSQGSNDRQLPWTLSSTTYAGAVDSPGRPKFEIRSLSPTATRARVIHVPRRELLAWFCGLGTLAFTAWRSSVGRWTAVWLLTLTVIATFAPPDWIAVTGAAWIGAVAGAFTRFLLQPSEGAAQSPRANIG